MFTGYEYSLVGENCSEYKAKYVLHEASITNLAHNCVNCTHYNNGSCSKELFNKIYGNLSIN